MLSDRLAYLVTVDPRQAVAGFGAVGNAAAGATKKADLEMARLQKRIDQLNRSAARAGRANDPLGADVARIKAAGLRKELDDLQAPAKGTRARLDSIGVGGEVAAAGLALAGAAAVKFGVDAAMSADRQATAQRATSTIFKGSAKDISDFAEDADQALGVSETAALNAANAFGNMFTKTGTAPAEAAKLAAGVTSLASVLAAARPAAGNTESALIALQAAFRGEFDPLEKFTVKINATMVEQRALKLGLGATTSALSEQDKQLATLQLLFEQTTTEQKLYAKNSETLAFRQQQTNAALQDFKDVIGGTLKSDVGGVAQAIAGLTKGIEGAAGLGDNAIFKFLTTRNTTNPATAVFSLAQGFNALFSVTPLAGDTLERINQLNVEGRIKAIAAAESLEEQAKIQQKVTDTQRDALSAAEALADADDRVTAAKKAVAEASDDEVEKAEKVAEARRQEADASERVVDAEEALARARRDAPEEQERAEIAARRAKDDLAETEKELAKVRRRRGDTDPRTLKAEDDRRLAALDLLDAEQRIQDLQGKSGVPKAVEDAIKARDDALRARDAAEKHTNEILAINPYEAQQKAAKDLRDAERDRGQAVTTLMEKLPLVNKELWNGFDASKATREQVDLMVTALGQAVVEQGRLNALTAAERAAAQAIAAANAGGLAMPGATQVTPAPGINPATGVPLVPGASARRVAASSSVGVQITGPVTVVAQDPDEMGRKIEAKQRRRRLVEP